MIDPEVSETPGKRRSQRHRVAPLKFWKGDNIQYKLDEKGLPVAEGIVKGPSVIPTLSRYVYACVLISVQSYAQV